MATAATSATSSTNLDVNSIVSQLMTVERQPINKLNVKEAGYQTRLSAYGSIKGAVAGFQTAMQSLSSASKFTNLDAIPSDDTILSATASSIAVAGTYSLEVTSLAQAQKLVATGQASSSAAIGDGTATTVTFDFGTINGGTLDPVTQKYTGVTSFGSNGNGTKSITIDSSNNSLQGIRDAINAAKMGVTATIINDGGSAPYRLALSSDSNGVSNSLKISVSGDASVSNLLAHDPAATQNLSETVTAKNADFKVNGVSVSKTSNSVSDVIQGVTLNLKKITTSPTTLTVAHDNASVSNSVSGFVKAYNDLAKTLKDISAYNPSTKQAAILQGDSTVRSLQSQLRNALGSPVAGASGALTTLSQIGISFQKDGSLGLDNNKLNSAIANNVSDIASLFTAVGKGTDSLVSYNSVTSNTKAGSYAVNVAQIATQGNTVGNAAANTTITNANKALDLTVNGVSTSVTLNVGVYTAQTLAAELQAKINGAGTFSSSGITVAVTQSSGVLSVTSSSYGSTSSVAVGGAGVSDLLGAIPTQTAGVDVAGSIGGAIGIGSGQILSDSQGLNITINGGALGNRGSLNFSNGYAFSLDKWASSVLTTDGALASRTDGINTSIKDVGSRRTAMETRLLGIEKRYRAQFSSLDMLLSSMNQTSNYLTQQLAQIAKL
ncbi:flagellar filament capping protein FliD [Candidatus Nitrotoga sp. 1052]|uniref:flagellar filament capping protein FliD n=1 Tax=Candidatus Nitrotoga sp. 1052 TaxID=2886964 RepID=UPI001EF62844|nr:flagellar filament capping protein FliD [Candidatus Nitrotoga sp. 1052]CAH1073800.1 Flagellar hook-associated protein fliD [Candidatus Nitrotoga sp. 1052]